MQVRPPIAVNVFKATQGSDLDSMYVPLIPEHTFSLLLSRVTGLLMA